MISALVIAAASFVPPSFTPANAAQLQQAVAAKDKGSAAVLIDAQVDPKGRVGQCKAVPISGDAALANSVCAQLQDIRIEPASIQGEAVYGVLRQAVGLGAAADKGAATPADLELDVNTLPSGAAILRVQAAVVVNAEGKPQACYAANDAPQAYADVTCTQMSGITFGTLKDGGGTPVRYVRTVIVDFRASPAAG